NGTDTFIYKVTETQGTASSPTVAYARVIVTVNPVNDPPVAVGDSYSTNEDTTLTVPAPGVLANDSDVDSCNLMASVVTNPANGSLSLGSDGSFVYTANPNYNGPDSFTYKVSDGQLDSNIATVALSVTPVNDPPVAIGDSYATAEDTPLNVAAPGVLG